MAKQQVIQKIQKKEITIKGIHSKSKTSVNKLSKNYRKPYKGQGK